MRATKSDRKVTEGLLTGPVGTRTSDEQASRRPSGRVHPIVGISYLPRVAGHAMTSLVTASTLLDRDWWYPVGILVLGFLWPQLAYLVSRRSVDTRRAGFSVLLGDGFVAGSFASFTGFSLLPAGVTLALISGLELMMGGGIQLLKASPFLAAGLGLGYLIIGFEPLAPPTSLTITLCVIQIAGTFVAISRQVHVETLKMAAVRRDLKRAVSEISSIAEVARTVNSTLDEQEVLSSVHRALESVFAFDQIGIWRFDPERSKLVLDAALGAGVPEDLVNTVKRLQMPMESVFGTAMSSRKVAYFPRLGPDQVAEMHPADRLLYRASPSKAILVLPLVIADEAIGVISFSNTAQPFDLAEQDIESIELYVTHLATAIRNAHLFEEAEAARAEAIEANEAKSTFLANMSHELRTPMNAIIGYSEMLQEEAEDQGLEELIPDLGKVQTASKHLLGLINDVLDLSKIEAGKMQVFAETIETDELIDGVVDTLKPLVEQNGNRFEVHRGSALGEMRTDATMIRQVLSNLLSNAAKFTEDGTVILEVHREAAEGEDWMRLSVSDTGIGMTPEQIEVIFQPFAQVSAMTTRNYGGTGLGLSITRHLCEMMGGKVTVTSDEGKGSTFAVRVPVNVESRSTEVSEHA